MYVCVYVYNFAAMTIEVCLCVHVCVYETRRGSFGAGSSSTQKYDFAASPRDDNIGMFVCVCMYVTAEEKRDLEHVGY